MSREEPTIQMVLTGKSGGGQDALAEKLGWYLNSHGWSVSTCDGKHTWPHARAIGYIEIITRELA